MKPFKALAYIDTDLLEAELKKRKEQQAKTIKKNLIDIVTPELKAEYNAVVRKDYDFTLRYDKNTTIYLNFNIEDFTLEIRPNDFKITIGTSNKLMYVLINANSQLMQDLELQDVYDCLPEKEKTKYHKELAKVQAGIDKLISTVDKLAKDSGVPSDAIFEALE